MNIFEEIIMILGQKGQATIPSIWEEIKLTGNLTGRGKSLDLPYLQSFINHKREWFSMKEDIVSIRPEREPVKFIFMLNGYPGPEVKVTIDFIRNTFTYFEWNFDKNGKIHEMALLKPGNVEDFKKKLYFLHIWDWERFYQSDGIIVDGQEWAVVLETKGGIFKSEGLESFPREWKKVCRAVSRLTGVQIK